MSSQLHLGAEIGQFLWIENLENWDFDASRSEAIIIMHCYNITVYFKGSNILTISCGSEIT